MRILLVEDDPMIGEAVSLALKDAAYAVDWVKNGLTALQVLSDQEHEAVLLDLGLPGKDGLAVLEHLRQQGQTVPVLIITARDGLADRVQGLDLGADDYLIKPFEIIELLARLRAITRRLGGQAQACLSNGKLSLNPATHEAQFEGKTAVLTPREFSLVHALLLRPGTILARSELEGRIYGWNEEVESNAIDFLIHSVRKKLSPNAIKNIRGAGWLVDRVL